VKDSKAMKGGKAALSRRGFFALLGLGGAAVMLRHPIGKALAAEGDAEPVYLVFCTFRGGWDQLLALDPRDARGFTDPKAIFPAYDIAAANDPALSQALADSGGSGLVRPDGSNIAFGPAIGKLANRYRDLTVVRGVFMGTLTHEVGRRYFLTGKFPRGLQAAGSSLATWAVSESGDHTPIPNLVVGTESYNEGLASYASGLVVQSSGDMLAVLSRIGQPLPDASARAVDDYMWAEKCADRRLDGGGRVTQYLDSFERAKVFSGGTLAPHFTFRNPAPTPALADLYATFGIDSSNAAFQADIAGPKGQALIAAQALTQGVSQAVSIELATDLDHHDDDWADLHAGMLRTGFDALDSLIGHLQATEIPGTGKSFWDRTVLIAGSDFARTPYLNSRGGRDHHLASSVLLAGMGLKGNTVIGATDDETMAAVTIDPATGAADPSGISIRPADVHATLLAAAGLDHSHLENQDPRVLSALLR